MILGPHDFPWDARWLELSICYPQVPATFTCLLAYLHTMSICKPLTHHCRFITHQVSPPHLLIIMMIRHLLLNLKNCITALNLLFGTIPNHTHPASTVSMPHDSDIPENILVFRTITTMLVHLPHSVPILPTDRPLQIHIHHIMSKDDAADHQ